MRQKAIKIFMMSVFFVVCFRQEMIAGELLQTELTILKTEKKSAKHTGDKAGWHELRGSLNRKPVYLIVEKIGHQRSMPQQVAGYLFDKKGKRKYIYGEWYKDELQVYDKENKRHIILLHK
jgi:hypothetical protein